MIKFEKEKEKEKEKVRQLNSILNSLNNIQRVKANEKCQQNVEMFNIADKYRTKTYDLHIQLLELALNHDGIRLDVTLNVSPQEILIGVLEGNKNYKNIYNMCEKEIRNQIKDDINMSSILGNMVTANTNKTVWFKETHLYKNAIIDAIVCLTIDNMINLLKTCPDTNINFRRGVFLINTPFEFIKIINDSNYKEMFDFIPYVKNKSVLRNDCVYRLIGNVKLFCVTSENGLKDYNFDDVSDGSECDCKDCMITANTKTITTNNNITSNKEKYGKSIIENKKILIQSISDSDINSLNTNGWVTNIIIDLYLHNLIIQNKKEKQICIWNSSYFTYLFTKKTKNNVKDDYTNKAIFYRIKGVIMSKYHTLIIPININSSHWILLIVKIEERSLFLLNSLLNFNRYDQKIINLFKMFLELDDIALEKWNFFILPSSSINIPQQQNLNDCGIFCIKYAEHFITKNNFEFEFSSKDIAFLRNQIKNYILEIIKP